MSDFRTDFIRFAIEQQVLLFQPGKKTLVGRRTNAVEIGTDNPHFHSKSAWLLVLRPIRGFPLMCYA